jgi:hypothetical protein
MPETNQTVSIIERTTPSQRWRKISERVASADAPAFCGRLRACVCIPVPREYAARIPPPILKTC